MPTLLDQALQVKPKGQAQATKYDPTELLALAVAYVEDRISLAQARDALGFKSNGQARTLMSSTLMGAARQGRVKVSIVYVAAYAIPSTNSNSQE